MNINAAFSGINNTSEASSTYTSKTIMNRSGNFLSFEDSDKTVYNLSFISDIEAFLSINNESSGEYFVLRFTAN